ncbi:hypothetical protein [Kitasatospora sp. NBC_01302]|uniref:hypothetical protein n=1 Tax=Kitasatospora sp. NBC_01302 TaxID=2903575 RepID=UPI002E1293B6|nr:hypothetical protein OG294_37945 [Kitasatospora sp. NBC_01302]
MDSPITTHDWSGRTMLVTGAEGFIGSTLVRLAGWQPRVDLAEGLQRTSDRVAEHLHLLAPGRYQV